MEIQKKDIARKDFSTEKFKTDLSIRILEDHEIISGEEGIKYANRKDDRSLNYSMVALDIAERFGLQGKPHYTDEPRQILEVCSGSGQLARYLSEHTHATIIATDGSRELISSAKQRYGPISKIRFEVQDLHNHPYRGENDVVVCKDSFHHLTDPKQAIEELLGLAKPGGYVYIYDLARDAPSVQVERRISLMESDHEKTRILQSLNASFTRDEIKEILNQSSAEAYEIVEPLRFSDESFELHKDQIGIDRVKEHEFDGLSRILILKKVNPRELQRRAKEMLSSQIGDKLRGRKLEGFLEDLS